MDTREIMVGREMNTDERFGAAVIIAVTFLVLFVVLGIGVSCRYGVVG